MIKNIFKIINYQFNVLNTTVGCFLKKLYFSNRLFDLKKQKENLY